jgi:hypothetical protein
MALVITIVYILLRPRNFDRRLLTKDAQHHCKDIDSKAIVDRVWSVKAYNFFRATCALENICLA